MITTGRIILWAIPYFMLLGSDREYSMSPTNRKFIAVKLWICMKEVKWLFENESWIKTGTCWKKKGWYPLMNAMELMDMTNNEQILSRYFPLCLVCFSKNTHPIPNALRIKFMAAGNSMGIQWEPVVCIADKMRTKSTVAIISTPVRHKPTVLRYPERTERKSFMYNVEVFGCMNNENNNYEFKIQCLKKPIKCSVFFK